MANIALHKEGDTWILEVPEDQIDQLGLDDGQQLQIAVRSAPSDAERRQRIDAIMDEVIVEYREAFEYLADHSSGT